MGILADLTPAIFKLEDVELRARVLPVSETIAAVKEALFESEGIEGDELDKRAEQAVDDFDFTNAAMVKILYASIKTHTEGFEPEDAELLIKAKYIETGYRLAKYAIYGHFDDGKKKVKKPTQNKATKKKKARKKK